MADKKKENIFTRLTNLFKSGPIVKRKISAYDTTLALPPGENTNLSSGLMLFQKSTNISYTEALAGTYQLADRVARYQDFNEMEYCLAGETKIAVPGGFKTIKELSEEYGLDKEFIVYSYDHNINRIVAAKAKQARQTRIDKSFKVKFKDGKEIIGSGNHRLLLRNGTYCRIDELQTGDSLMPFIDSSKNKQRYIYTFDLSINKGWRLEDDLIYDVKNSTKNQIEKNRKFSFGNIIEACSKFDFNLKKISEVYDISENDIKDELKKYNFKNFEQFKSVYDLKLRKNKFLEVNFNNLAGFYRHGKNLNYLAKKLNSDNDTLTKIILNFGYSDLDEFQDTFLYSEILSIEENGEIPLYDLTVDGYKNFATDSVISHNTPEIAAALDIYADETCAQDEKGRTLHVYSNNPKIKKILEELFYNVLNCEFSLRSWARSLCKHGDFFLYNDISPKYGVVNVFPIPVSELEREENYDPQDPFAVRYRWLNRGNRFLENWEVTHMRLLGNDTFVPYGSSIIEPARKIWKQLVLIEDAMLVYRLVRAPERRVFYVDVGNLPAENVPTYVEQLRKNLRTNQIVDKSSGKMDLRYNPMSIEEDYFIPVRGSDTGTKIDSLAGGQNTSAVEDVEYLQKKLFAALKIPRAYLGYDESLASKATLAQEDIRFSRTINVIQRTIIAELNKIAIIHLFSHGYDGDDLLDFVLHLSNPSTIAQIQKMELWKTKFELAGSAPEGMLSKTFVRKEILGLNDEQIDFIDKQRIEEKLKEAEIENAEAEEEEDSEDSSDESADESETSDDSEEESSDEDDIMASLTSDKRSGLPIKVISDVVKQKYSDESIIEEEKNKTKEYYRKYKKNRKRRRIKNPAKVNLINYVSSDKDPYDKKSLTSSLLENQDIKIQLPQTYINMLKKMDEKLSLSRKKKEIL